MLSKCQVQDLLQVELGVLADAQAAYPAVKDFVKDIDRVSLLANTRGLAFFTLDLPNLDSLLLAGLRDGSFRPHGPLSRAVSKKDGRPRLFRSLWSQVFDKNCCLLGDADPTAILFLRQLFCLGKKIEAGCSPERTEQAVQDYYRIEASMVPPSLDWEGDDLGNDDDIRSLSFCADRARAEHHDDLFGQPGVPGSNIVRPDVLDRIFGHISAVLGEFNSLDTVRYRHGPGAVADLKGSGFKYQFPTWPAKLDYLFPFDWCGATHIDQEDRPSLHEPPSRLIAVPKTAKAPRLIAAEPVAHQWCQQAIFGWLDQRFRSTWIGEFINLRRQDLSQEMVYASSVSGDLSTVDLSSASDRLSCWTVERAFRRNPSFLRALHASRTRWVTDEVSLSRSYLKIKKFAAMGSAVTFPVQSLVFLGLALHSCGWDGSLKDLARLKGRIRVFGDDIILPKDGYAPLLDLLSSLGLKANMDKSFHTGNFRESCGADAWQGHDVTPVKPKVLGGTDPSSVESTIELSNNLWKKGFWRAATAALSTVPRKWISHLRRTRALEGCSLFTFCGDDVSHLEQRYNHDLHRNEVRCTSVSARTTRKRVHAKESLLQYFTERPRPDLGWTSGVGTRPKRTIRLRWEAVA